MVAPLEKSISNLVQAVLQNWAQPSTAQAAPPELGNQLAAPPPPPNAKIAAEEKLKMASIQVAGSRKTKEQGDQTISLGETVQNSARAPRQLVRCLRCGDAFKSRNKLMKHVFSDVCRQLNSTQFNTTNLSLGPPSHEPQRHQPAPREPPSQAQQPRVCETSARYTQPNSSQPRATQAQQYRPPPPIEYVPYRPYNSHPREPQYRQPRLQAPQHPQSSQRVSRRLSPAPRPQIQQAPPTQVQSQFSISGGGGRGGCRSQSCQQLYSITSDCKNASSHHVDEGFSDYSSHRNDEYSSSDEWSDRSDSPASSAYSRHSRRSRSRSASPKQYRSLSPASRSSSLGQASDRYDSDGYSDSCSDGSSSSDGSYSDCSYESD